MDDVRVYLEYLHDLDETRPEARRATLQSTFERLIDTTPDADVRLDPETLSESGQAIEAVVPADRVAELKRHYWDHHVRVQPVRTYDAT